LLARGATPGDACEDGFGEGIAGGLFRGKNPATAGIPQPIKCCIIHFQLVLFQPERFISPAIVHSGSSDNGQTGSPWPDDHKLMPQLVASGG
jgi:hypothetical protein